MNEMLIIFFSIILTENYSLTRFFSFMNLDENESETKNLGALGLVLTIVLVISTTFMYPIYQLLKRYKVSFLYGFISVIVILIMTRFIRYFVPKISKPFFELIKNSLLIITINSTLLGTFLLTVQRKSFSQAIVTAFASGAGYTLAIMIFRGINFRIKEADIPKIFRGIPILLVSAFIATMAFEGFGGIFTGLFK